MLNSIEWNGVVVLLTRGTKSTCREDEILPKGRTKSPKERTNCMPREEQNKLSFTPSHSRSLSHSHPQQFPATSQSIVNTTCLNERLRKKCETCSRTNMSQTCATIFTLLQLRKLEFLSVNTTARTRQTYTSLSLRHIQLRNVGCEERVKQKRIYPILQLISAICNKRRLCYRSVAWFSANE